MPMAPRTIHDAMPMTRKWWPEWDHRTKLNCLQTMYVSVKLTERIRKVLEESGENVPEDKRKYVMEECRKWNLGWEE